MLLAPLVLPFGAGLSLVHRTRQSYQRLPNVFMTYTVDLVHILEILFSLPASNDEGKLTLGAVRSAFSVYYESEMRRNVHRQINGFTYKVPGRDTVLDKIVSLVSTSPIDDNDIFNALENIPLDSPELEESIAFRRSTLQLTPEGHVEHVVSLVNLADDLHERFKRMGVTEDLQEIITLRRSALRLTPKWHPYHVVSLVNLADDLQERFKRVGGMEDFQEVIALRRSALQLTPEGHPEHVVSLVNLADSLYERFKREGSMEDLQEIITLRQSALQLTPKGHSKRVVALINLADSLHEHFKREGGTENLQEIITLRRSASQLASEGHPEHVVSLVNLADSLYGRFQREGSMEDLQEIITLRQSALQLTPEGHSKRVVSLANLADSLYERFKREGDMQDLRETIALRRSASQLASEGHPEHVVSLVNLADSLYGRFQREGSMEDLQEIITLRQSALQLTPEGHSKRVVSLVNLVDSLHERFKREGRMEDLQEIIALRRSVLQCTPPGHPGRFLSLVNLSNSLQGRFIKGGTLADLDEIIAFRRAASECTAPTPSDRCTLLLNLANSLREKYQKLGLDADLREAIKCACAASVGSPSEQDASCRDCIVSCVQLNAQKSRLPAPTVQVTSPVRPSGVKQIVQSIAAKIIQTLPLRLLNTYTGTLCDRNAQISCFEESAQYKELQSFTCDNPESELCIHNAISKYFGYTTLSHRWGAGEPLLRDVQGVNIYSLDDREGFAKLQRFCAFTLEHGYRWAWSDTCCIDKDSSSELQEAIASMFAWYRNSALTIVYLSDVFGTTSFVDSIWFKRGWTLQELLAPRRVLFYAQDWSLYKNCTSSNHKSDATILTELRRATGIGELQLKNFSPGVHDVRSKLLWASTRYTTRAEDIAYSLFGIFQVSLPALYGENTPGALGRLLEDIISRSGDVSVLDWVGEASSFHSCFPTDLTPYKTVSRMQLPSGSSTYNSADLESGHELYKALVRSPSPRFVARRLVLTCIVYRVVRVNLLETSSATPYHDYELVASGLVPLKLKLSSRLQEGSGAGLPYVLVRPWSPRLLDLLARDDVPGSLLEWLRQPFNALLLHSPRHTEYKRIASDCSIIASVEDLASVVHSECQTLEIV
ncbi:hypothetical protein EDD15DRAFT_1718049 [Pisolithus albus]|nr:hypothetical protein EDD15DRAFT_1718049 [Pisolithus albus]